MTQLAKVRCWIGGDTLIHACMPVYATTEQTDCGINFKRRTSASVTGRVTCLWCVAGVSRNRAA